MMSEDVWGLVGAPMLADNDGNAVFIYTTKRGRNHSKLLFQKAQEDKSGRWATFVFSSFDNPHVSADALTDLVGDMTQLAYRAEILAEEIEDDPRALWNREMIPHVTHHLPFTRVVIGVDPPGSAEGAECGIVVTGKVLVNGIWHAYVIEDRSRQGTPGQWGSEVVAGYYHNKADRIVGEINYGGDMVENTIRNVENGRNVAYKAVHASRGKAVRAEPIVAMYEQGRVHHVGEFKELEDEMCNWVPGESGYSPNRVDAVVWALTELLLTGQELGVMSYRPIQSKYKRH